MRVLVTGSVGFIGYHLCAKLAEDGHEVVGLDNLSDYYSVSLKEERLARLMRLSSFRFYKADVTDAHALEKVFVYGYDAVVHLAAQAGVRYSLENPAAYVQTNIVGFANVLECCRQHGVKRLLFASSSSVYGETDCRRPSVENDNTSQPVSLYAATKKADEVLAYSYAHLYGIKTIGLRFFTVYGEWGRPDMAYYKFAECLSSGQPFGIYNDESSRDFTYVGDVVECVSRIVCGDVAPYYAVYNVGGGTSVRLKSFFDVLARLLGERGLIKDNRYFVNSGTTTELGDVTKTWADTSALERDYGYKPSTSIEVGLRRFADWYADYKK